MTCVGAGTVDWHLFIHQFTMKNKLLFVLWFLAAAPTSFCLINDFNTLQPPDPPLDEIVAVAKRSYCPLGGGDKNAGCAYWRKLGYCSSAQYRTFIKKTCPATCGWCQPRPTPPPTAVVVRVNERECLQAHNKRRALHGAQPLTWDRSLARQAQTYALKLASKNFFEHSEWNGQGENLYLLEATKRIPTCKDAVKVWYDEVEHYPFWNPPKNLDKVSAQIGHFTQIVWKSTQRVGVGIAKIRHGFWTKTYIVARYTPPGNAQGKYSQEVGRPLIQAF